MTRLFLLLAAVGAILAGAMQFTAQAQNTGWQAYDAAAFSAAAAGATESFSQISTSAGHVTLPAWASGRNSGNVTAIPAATWLGTPSGIR